jgi:DNA modification methylase
MELVRSMEVATTAVPKYESLPGQTNFLIDAAPLAVKEQRWELLHGDSIELMATLRPASVDFSIFSPPFPSLFSYTDSERDIGNSESFAGDAKIHLQFFFNQLIRLIKPGRVVICHCQQIAALKRNGEVSTIDFRGLLIRIGKRAGFQYDSDWPVSKNPQALRNGTGVLTPRGFIPIDLLSVGSEVIGSNGFATKVAGVYPHESRPMYRVGFSDGVSIDCDGRHLWTVKTMAARFRDGESTTITTEQMERIGAKSPSGGCRWSIPMIPHAEFAAGEPLPIDPYTLGVLLGDGMLSSRGVVGVCTEAEIAESMPLPQLHFAEKLPKSERGNDVAAYHVRCKEWHRNDVLESCRELGIAGKRAWEKSIPAKYLFASRADRISLLQGLMDTDGSHGTTGGCRFATTSPDLAKGIQFLVESLGGMCRIKKSVGNKYLHKGEQRQGRPTHCCIPRLPVDICPFRMPRKANKWKPLARTIHRRIVSIEKIDSDQCTCITVATSDGLFVTEHCVVTHNSQAIRTRSRKLQFASLQSDRAELAPAFNDYLIKFRAPGANAVPIIEHEPTRAEWIEWAEGIWDWHAIRETDTLNTAAAKGEDDTRHICPLQLPVIRRCVRLFSNPNEVVFSPFAGIGSEGYISLLEGRRFLGIELKKEYFEAAKKNLARAESKEHEQMSLFGGE